MRLLTSILVRLSLGQAALAAAATGSAHAHAYGERYDLPVPLWLNLVGGGAVVVLSFVITAAVLSPAALMRQPQPHRPIVAIARPPWSLRALATVLRIFSVFFFALAIVTGFLGELDFARNAAPTIAWALGWVGLAFVCAFAGNVWLWVNPWLVLFEWAEGLWRRLSGSAHLSFDLPYPERIGVLPGIVLIIAFVWFMLASGVAGEPRAIAAALTVYSLITWVGMLLFGPATWIARGEAFSLIADILARFGPAELRVTDPAICARAGCPPDLASGCSDCVEAFYRAPRAARSVAFRPWGTGLAVTRPLSRSMVIVAIMLLALVSFEGLMDTAHWIDLMVRLGELERSDGIHAPVKTTLAFVLATAMLYAAFYLVSALMRRIGYAKAGVPLGAQPWTTTDIMGLFVLSLIPIALAYHVAHYLYWLITNVQFAIPAASDPFGWGWNLFGTRDYFPNRTAVSLGVIWHTAVAAIVVGHVIALYIAHRVALAVFGTRRAALWSQAPMLVLMVVYTMSSLWMLAQPIMG